MAQYKGELKMTTEKKKLYNKQLYLKNREKRLEYQKQYDLDNKVKRKEYLKEYYLDYKERPDVIQKRNEPDNIIKRKEYAKQWFQSLSQGKKEQRLAQVREYKQRRKNENNNTTS
jgi:hypothetical protein